MLKCQIEKSKYLTADSHEYCSVILKVCEGPYTISALLQISLLGLNDKSDSCKTNQMLAMSDSHNQTNEIPIRQNLNIALSILLLFLIYSFYDICSSFLFLIYPQIERKSERKLSMLFNVGVF